MAWDADPTGVIIHRHLEPAYSTHRDAFSGLRRGRASTGVIVDGVTQGNFWYSLGQQNPYRTDFGLVGPPDNPNVFTTELYIIPEGENAALLL